MMATIYNCSGPLPETIHIYGKIIPPGGSTTVPDDVIKKNPRPLNTMVADGKLSTSRPAAARHLFPGRYIPPPAPPTPSVPPVPAPSPPVRVEEASPAPVVTPAAAPEPVKEAAAVVEERPPRSGRGGGRSGKVDKKE